MITTAKHSIVFQLVTGKGRLTLFVDGKPISSFEFDENSSHSQSLVDSIHTLMLDNDLSRFDLQYLSVLTGPGNFTSLRVSISTALGLARAVKIPVVSISLIDVINNEILGVDDIVFLKVGKSQIIKHISGSFQMIDLDYISEELMTKSENGFYVDNELFSILSKRLETLPTNLFVFRNIDEIVGEIGFQKFTSGNFSPVIPHYLEYGS
jgi:tRNA A37 threonylcarbamoyladenosine modification protein TsaB